MPGAPTVHLSSVQQGGTDESSTSEVMGRRIEALAHRGILLILKIRMQSMNKGFITMLSEKEQDTMLQKIK